MTKADNAFKEWLITSPWTTQHTITCISSLVSYTYIQIIPRLISFFTYKTMVSTDKQQAPSDKAILWIYKFSFEPLATTIRKEIQILENVKEAMYYFSHPIKYLGKSSLFKKMAALFFGKCTHSYETKAVLLQQHILQSWYHTRKAECLLNLDRNSFRKKN